MHKKLIIVGNAKSNAYSTIALGISELFRSVIEETSTADEVWEALKAVFELKSRAIDRI